MHSRTAEALARRFLVNGTDPGQVVELTRGSTGYQHDAAAALEHDRESLPWMRDAALSTAQDQTTPKVPAVRALSHSPEDRPLLRALVEADEYPVRAAAISALRGDAALRPLFLRAITHRAPDVQAAAVRAVGRLPEAREAVLELLEASAAIESTELRRWRAKARNAAAGALAGDPAAHAPLVRLADDWETREDAVRALTQEAKGRALARGWLEDDESPLQAAAIRALAADAGARPAIHRLLAHRATGVRLAAIEALAQNGAARVELVGLLLREGEEPRIRAKILELDLPADLAAPVRVLLRHDDLQLRAAAARFLARDAASLKTRLRLLSDPSEHVRIAAVASVSGEPGTRNALLGKLRDRAGVVRAAAVFALANDVNALPRIQGLGRDADSCARRAAFSVLARHEQTLPFVRGHLRPDLGEARRCAFAQLTERPAQRMALLALMAHADARVRNDICQALAPHAWARASLLESVDKGTPEAIEALSQDASLWPHFRALLTSRDELARRAAARALRADPESCGAFKTLLNDRDFYVRDAAVEALSRGPSAVTALRKLLRSGDEAAPRLTAARVLREIPAAQADFLALLTSDEEDPALFAEALGALAEPPKDESLVWDRLRDVDEWPNVRVAALQALSRWGAAREQLSSFLEDPAGEVRAAAVGVLVSDHSAAAQTVLRMKLADEQSVVRIEAARALRATRGETRGGPLNELAWVRRFHELGAPRIEEFLRRPRRLNIDEERELGEGVLGWACLRCAQRDRPEDAAFAAPEPGVAAEAFAGSVENPEPWVAIRLAADITSLAAVHGVLPLHVILEIQSLARNLIARRPPTLWLLCSDAPFVEPSSATVSKAGLVCGPGLYGLRLASPLA